MFSSVSNAVVAHPTYHAGQNGQAGVAGVAAVRQQEDTIRNELTVGRGNGPNGVCLTCGSRRYQDVSSDGGVSYQAPTHISPEASFAAVRAHEQEHITRDRASAEARGDEVVSQSVTYTVATCTECGKMYKSGGTATTVTRSTPDGERPAADGVSFEAYA